MNKIYKKYIEYFKNKKRPIQILDDSVLYIYEKKSIDFMGIYFEDLDDLNLIPSHIVFNIYCESSVLSDDFILFCLPKFIEIIVKNKNDCVLVNRLNRINFDKLYDEDSKMLSDRLKELQYDENIDLFGINKPIINKFGGKIFLNSNPFLIDEKDVSFYAQEIRKLSVTHTFVEVEKNAEKVWEAVELVEKDCHDK